MQKNEGEDTSEDDGEKTGPLSINAKGKEKDTSEGHQPMDRDFE